MQCLLGKCPTREPGECGPLSRDQSAQQLLLTHSHPSAPLPRSGPGVQPAQGDSPLLSPELRVQTRPSPPQASVEMTRVGDMGALGSQQRRSGGSSNLSLKTGSGGWIPGLRDGGRKGLGGQQEQRHGGTAAPLSWHIQPPHRTPSIPPAQPAQTQHPAPHPESPCPRARPVLERKDERT